MMNLSPAVRRAFAPPEKLKPSEWADRFRHLPADAAEGGGRYRGSRVPYIAGIMDALAEPGVEELAIMKAAQVAYTTMLGCLLGWIADVEPGPTLFVVPGEDDVDKLVEESFRPMIKATPQLRAHLPGRRDDITKAGIRFDTAPVYTGFAGSAATLAARAIRYVFLDEVDKYKATTGKEGSPIALARKRGSTFGHRRRLVMGCTPTTPDGHIARAWEDCGDHRHYHVPCPNCGHYQRLVFGQLRFDMPDVRAIEDRARRADYIEARGRAEYECERCRHRIATADRQAMLQAGRWVGDGLAERPTRVGFHVSALYSPWVKFEQLAGQFVRAQGNRANLREFRNQWLGETFDDVVQSVTVDSLRADLAKAELPPAGVVPPWAGKLIATVDVQGDRLYYVIRAWGRNRSRLVALNEVHTFDDVRAMVLDSVWPIEAADGEFLRVSLLFCDSGYRTNEVYHFAASDPRVKAVKGAPTYRPAATLTWSMVARELGINVGIVDTQIFKGVLAAERAAGRWESSTAVTDEYLRHLAAEQLKRDPKSELLMWLPVSEGAANHYLDCETYQFAAAQFAQVNLLPDEPTLVAQRATVRAERNRAAAQRLAAISGLPGMAAFAPAEPVPAESGWLNGRDRSGGWLP